MVLSRAEWSRSTSIIGPWRFQSIPNSARSLGLTGFSRSSTIRSVVGHLAHAALNLREASGRQPPIRRWLRGHFITEALHGYQLEEPRAGQPVADPLPGPPPFTDGH